MYNEVELYRMVLQTNYCEYCKYVNADWIATRFHRYLCDRVQSFIERESNHAYEIMVISCPPQHGKSVTITETLPSWYLGLHPNGKVIEISYSEDFAKRFGRNNKRKIEEVGADLFGIHLAKSPNTELEFQLDNHRGTMISRGILSGVTGNGANLIIIDDPVKTQQEADSESSRSRVWEEFSSSYKSRLAPNAKIILIMTRWHEEDLAGMIIDNENNVEVLNLPLEAEENDALGRNIGDALCPEIGKDNAWLIDFKSNTQTEAGTRTWNALYQGHPTSAQGNMIKREWWQYYTELPHIVDWLMSVDATFKANDNSDFVAIQVWGKTNGNIYFIDRVKKHLNMPETIREILRLRAMYPKCKTTLIEDKANGPAIIQQLRTTLTGIIPVNPIGSKIARVNAVIGAIESGNVYLPDKSWVHEFIDECASFPRGKHDDECFIAGTKIATTKGYKNIEDITLNDKIITPFGNRKVVDCGCTGIKEVVTRHGLTGTKNHPIFSVDKFIPLDALTQGVNSSIISLKELIIWKYKKLLSTMEQNTNLWGRENIILVSQQQMQEENVLKDFMLRFGNLIMARKFIKAIKFTIKVISLSIITFKTYSITIFCNIINNRKQFVLENTVDLLTNRTEKVYNLTVDIDHVYYANGLLVSNCDAMSQSLNRLIYYNSEPMIQKAKNTLEDAFPSLRKKSRNSLIGKGDKIHVV